MAKDDKGSAPKPDDPAGAASGDRRPRHTIDAEAEEVEETSSHADGVETQADAAEPATDQEAPAETAEEETSEDASETEPPPVPPRTAPSELRGFATHLAAGLLGGLIGVVTVGYGAGYLPLGEIFERKAAPAIDRAALEKRLAAIEARIAKPAAGPDESLKSGLASLDARVAGIEKRTETAEARADAAKQIAARVAGLEDKFAARGADSGSFEKRLAGLEETLKSVAAAAREGTGGGVAEAAALGSRITELGKEIDGRIATLRQELETAAAKRSQDLAAKLGAAPPGVDLEALTSARTALEARIREIAEEVTGLRQALADNAKRRDAARSAVEGDLAPLTERIAKLEAGLGGLLEREKQVGGGARSAALAIAFTKLKTKVDGGWPFAAELEAVARLVPKDADLTALKRSASAGVPSRDEIARALPAAMRAAHGATGDAPGGSLMGRLLHNASGLVTVRRSSPAKGKSERATLSRVEARAGKGDFAGAIEQAGALSGPVLAALKPWLDAAGARLAADKTMGDLESRLVRALGGAGSESAKR